MDSLRFADNLDGEDVVALGLPAARLALVGLGWAGAWALAQIPAAAAVRLTSAALVMLTTAALAWGRVHGVSLALWSWLAIGYLSRRARAQPFGRDEWFETEAESVAVRPARVHEAGPVWVAVLSARPGSGSTTVCRALADRLGAPAAELSSAAEQGSTAPTWTVPYQAGGRSRRLTIYDWGSAPTAHPASSRLAALVLIWDGLETPGRTLPEQVGRLRLTYPAAHVIVALNRAGPAAGLAARVAQAGARLVSAIPFDPALGSRVDRPSRATFRPAAEAIQALALAVLAAARSA